MTNTFLFLIYISTWLCNIFCLGSFFHSLPFWTIFFVLFLQLTTSIDSFFVFKICISSFTNLKKYILGILWITGDIVAAAGGNYTTLSITGKILNHRWNSQSQVKSSSSPWNLHVIYLDLSLTSYFLFVMYLDFDMIRFI